MNSDSQPTDDELESQPTDDLDKETDEFLMALSAFKSDTGRQFPTCREYLNLFRSLGYGRPSE